MRIAVVAPARGLDRRLADRAGALVRATHPKVELVIHPQCFLSDGHFAGPDAARADAFVDVANDPAIDAVWFARGGYGSNRLLDRTIDRLGAPAGDKAYLGYSDTGFLLAALYARGIGRPAHGPMVADLAREGGERAIVRALDWLVHGRAEAPDKSPAIALNLTILATLIGTGWLPDLTGHVLSIEEVSEPLYRIDRMFFQIGNARELRGLAGIRLGRINDVIPNDPPWGEPVETMVERWCAGLGVPMIGAADIGHDADNGVVAFGG